MKVYWGSGGIDPRILDLGTRWRWVVGFTLRPLHPQGKIPWYPLDRRLGGLQSRSGRGGEQKNSQPPPELEPLIIQLVAQRYTTELYRLLHFCVALKKQSPDVKIHQGVAVLFKCRSSSSSHRNCAVAHSSMRYTDVVAVTLHCVLLPLVYIQQAGYHLSMLSVTYSHTKYFKTLCELRPENSYSTAWTQ
jgi:hypothetical protein